MIEALKRFQSREIRVNKTWLGMVILKGGGSLKEDLTTDSMKGLY